MTAASPPSTRTTARIAGQSGLLMSGFALAQATSCVRNAIIGHWLAKGDFGIAAGITLTLQLVEILSDLGADRLIVQARDGADRRLMAAAHFVLVLRGVVLAMVLAVAAVPAAEFFHAPHAWPAFAAMALVPLIKGFLHLDFRRQQRELDNRAYVAIECAPQLAALAAIVPILWLEPTFNAVVGVAVAQSAVMVACSHALACTRFEIGFDHTQIGRLVAFGWPIWLSAFPLVLVFQGDRAIVGHILGLEVLAAYAAAFMVTMVPGLIAAKAGNAIVLPLLAQARDSSDEFRRRFILMFELATLAAVLYAALFVIAGGALLPLIMGPNYRGLELVTGWLAVMFAIRMIQAVPGMALMAHGETRPFLAAGTIRSLGLVGALAAVLLGYGLAGVAAAGVAGELASLAYMSWRIGCVVPGLESVCASRAAVLAPAIGVSVTVAATLGLEHLTVLAHLTVTFGMLALIAIGTATVMPALRGALLDLVRDALRSLKAVVATGPGG
jgi:O-antigen/teichoic acid export membrane protein